MANSSDKRDEGGAPAGAGWGKKDIAKGATLVDPEATGARTKGAFGAGTAPPPAGGEEDNAVATLFQDKAPSVGVAPPLPAGTPEPPPAAGDDPVGALFAPGSALPSPAMDDNPSNAEISRWEATNEGSLFDDRVKDPMPGEGAEPAEAAVQTASVAAVGSLHPEAVADRAPDDELIAADDLVTDVAPKGAPGPPTRQPAPPAQRADGPTIDPAAPGGVGVVIKPAPPVAPPPAAAPPPPAEAPEGYDVQEPATPPLPATAGKRRGKRRRKAPKAAKAAGPRGEPAAKPRRRRSTAASGRKNVALVLLALLALSAGLAVSIFLDVVPNPLAPEPTPRVARGLTRKAPKPKVEKPAPKAKEEATAPAETAKAAPVAKAATPVPTKTEPAPAKAEPEATAVPEPTNIAAAEPAPKAEPKPQSKADPSGGTDERSMLRNAKRLLADDEPEAAEALMRRLLAAEPRSHRGMELLARALMDQDRGAEAVKYAKQIVKRRKRRVSYRLLLGDALLMTGDAAGAKREWREALELDPTNRQTSSRLAM